MKSGQRRRIGLEHGFGRSRELLVALFVLGLILITPPLLIIFNKPNLSLGIPTLYLYLFAVWMTLVVLVALVVERPHSTGHTAKAGPEIGATGSEQAAQGSTDA